MRIAWYRGGQRKKERKKEKDVEGEACMPFALEETLRGYIAQHDLQNLKTIFLTFNTFFKRFERSDFERKEK